MGNIIQRRVRKNFQRILMIQNMMRHNFSDINDIHSFSEDFDDTERFSDGFDDHLRSRAGAENESDNVCLRNLCIIVIVWIIIITHYVF